MTREVKIGIVKWVSRSARTKELKNLYEILIEKPEEKILL
jgi:hypothetical protein